MYWRYMNTFNRIMPFMERSLCMRNGGSKFFMGDMVSYWRLKSYISLKPVDYVLLNFFTGSAPSDQI